MKFIHLSDLHIGKRVNEYSLIDDQKYILKEILNIINDEMPEAVIIAGDIYDKTVPSTDAVALFDDFLVQISNKNIKVLIISGNHDSPERIAFGGRLMEYSGIHISPVYSGKIDPVVLEDNYGKINIWLLPFVKPAMVKKYYEDYEINSYNDAIKAVTENMTINLNERNVMVTHQFITGSSRTESEEISVGGTDNVDVSLFSDFDYTALGHIHRPQNCVTEKVRYCGSPLKYSFSESKDIKSVTVFELLEKGNLNVKTVTLVPLRDMVEIRGKYQEIMQRDFYKNTSYSDDYVHITLTDEDDIPDAVCKLRTVYHNLMKLDYDNTRTANINFADDVNNADEKSPYENFSEFYEKQNNQPMDSRQCEFMKKLIEEIWEETL